MPRPRLSHTFWPWAALTLLALGLGGAAGVGIVALGELPQVDALETYRPKGVTALTDIRGRPVHEFYLERRIPLSFESIPPFVRNAFLVAEDWRFYDHFGVDLRGLARAALKNLFEQRYAEGASTITQQLAKVLFLTPEKTLRRKLKEALLALQIERRYSKNEIFGLYLNQIYLGSGCYGVEAAARTYFGKPTGELTIGETALLAGLPKAPNVYSPFRNPEAARQRRDTVLHALYERNLVSRQELDVAREEPISSAPREPAEGQTHFSAYVFGLLAGELGEDRIYRGHLAVETTLDLDLQRAAENAVADAVQAYANRHRIPLEDEERLPQGALLALDAGNGEIRAMVGGLSFARSQFNRAIQALRQPGSAFKPVVYAAALERGYSQSAPVEDEPLSFHLPGGRIWKPRNYDDTYDGSIPLRVALEQSKNVAAVRLLQAIGVAPLRQMAARLGIASPVAPNLSSALGSSSLSLAELARAYGVLAGGGIRHPLRAVRSVRTESGANLWPPPAPSDAVLDPKVAFVLTDMLTGVIREGTGKFAADLPCAVAGKTGTTDEFVDALFVGFNTRIVAAVWIGFDDRKSLGAGETGARAAGPAWKQFVARTCAGAADFLPPPGVLLVDVDHSSGKLPGRYCTDVITEAFVEGTEPAQECSEETIPRL